MIGRVEVNRDVIEAVCRLLSKIKRRGFAKGELLQSSGATGFSLQRSVIKWVPRRSATNESMGQNHKTRLELVEVLKIVAPMSAEAWRKLTTWLEEAEEGVVGRLDVEDEAARVGERDDVRRCWKRVGRMGWIVWKEFSEEKFKKYWERVTRN